MKTARRLIYFLASFIVGFGALAALSMQTGLFVVQKIPIEISKNEAVPGTVSPLASRLTARVGKFAQHKIWEVDLDEMRKELTADEWVEKVSILRAFPNQIKVSVDVKRPLLLFVTGSGDVRAVARDASLLPAIDPSMLPDAPVLRGEFFQQDKNARARAIEFVSQLPEQGPLSAKNIAEISYGKDEGYRLTLIGSKTEIKLGEDRVPVKVLRVTQVLNYLSANHLKGRVIDASFSKKVLVRLRKGS